MNPLAWAIMNIAVFPWLAFWPYDSVFGAFKAHSSKGSHNFFHLCSQKHRSSPQTTPNLARFLSFVKISLPQVKKLPENAEATNDMPYEQVINLKLAQDRLKTPMAKFLEDSTPDIVLFNFTSIASKFNISMSFLAYSPLALRINQGFTGLVS